MIYLMWDEGHAQCMVWQLSLILNSMGEALPEAVCRVANIESTAGVIGIAGEYASISSLITCIGNLDPNGQFLSGNMSFFDGEKKIEIDFHDTTCFLISSNLKKIEGQLTLQLSNIKNVKVSFYPAE